MQLALAAGSPSQFIDFVGDSAAEARAAAMQQLTSLSSGVALIQAASQRLATSFRQAQELGAILAGPPSLSTSFPQSPVGAQFEQVAALINARASVGASRQIFFVTMGGFDTHSVQLAAQNILFEQLDAALAAFVSATVEMGVSDQVTTFTMSDFSRTLTPNNDGTDHGWGGHHIILGGAVRGGDLYGTFPELIPGGPDDSAGAGRWIPTTSVDQYAATLASWFGVPSSLMRQVAPNIENFSVQNLGFI